MIRWPSLRVIAFDQNRPRWIRAHQVNRMPAKVSPARKYVTPLPRFQSGFSPSISAVQGVSRTAPARIGIRYARESQVLTCFSVRAEKNEATIQLISQAIQINASNCVGHVAVHPLQTKATIGLASCGMPGLYPSVRPLPNVRP